MAQGEKAGPAAARHREPTNLGRPLLRSGRLQVPRAGGLRTGLPMTMPSAVAKGYATERIVTIGRCQCACVDDCHVGCACLRRF